MSSGNRIVVGILVLMAAWPSLAQEWSPIGLASGSAPPGWSHASAIYDPVEHRVVVFAGSATIGLTRDVWAFGLDTRTWTRLVPAGADAPPRRFTPNAVYDHATRRLITWSGQGLGGTFFNDVWAFDLEAPAWTDLSPESGRPNVRYGTVTVFDPDARSFFTFGGFTDQGRFMDTWRFDVDGNTWLDVTPQAGSPTRRCLHSASFDPVQRRMVIYAGQQSGPLDDVWLYDIAGGTWTDVTPKDRPAGRFFAAQAFDTIGRRALVFGGNLSSGATAEVLAFHVDGGSWDSVATTGTAPSAREGASAVWIPQENRLIVLGGYDGNQRNDVWSLDFSPGENVVFPETILPAGDRFTWHSPLPVEWIRGHLADLTTLEIESSGSDPWATSIPLGDDPLPGAGYYYLARPAGSRGSWQTATAAEPARDSALP